MYGSFVLLDERGKVKKGERVTLEDVKGKNEGWLRDTLFENPDIIPIDDIDSSFGPLLPLCKELRTDSGQIDAVFINQHGRLTIVECKLWKNPQARREVVAQTLDYVSALTDWSYDDLQRGVAAASGRANNSLFQLAQDGSSKGLREKTFAEAVARSLWEGRILALIVGDGIRAGVQSLADLVNRNATKAFSFGLIEVALYRFGAHQFAVQPRVLLKTELIARQVTIVTTKDGSAPITALKGEDRASFRRQLPQTGDPGRGKDHLKEWWRPVLNMNLDGLPVERPFWVGTNNVVVNTPFPGIQIKAYAIVNDTQVGVFVSGPRKANLLAIQKYVKRERRSLLEKLPQGTEVRSGGGWPIAIFQFDLSSDDERRAWIIAMLRVFVRVLFPYLQQWHDNVRSKAE